jgi:hypothetical protein
LARCIAVLNPLAVHGRRRAASQDGGRAFRDAGEDRAHVVIERDDGFLPLPALAGPQHDCIVTDVRPREADQVAKTQARVRSQVDGVGEFGRAHPLHLGNVGIVPDDLGAVGVIQTLDPLARIAGNLAQWINRMGEHARQNLHAIVGGAWLIGPLIAPASNDGPDHLRSVELRNAQLAEILRNAVEPRRPVLARRIRKLGVVGAGLIGHDQELEAAGIRCAAVLDGLIVGRHELG